MAKVRQTTEGRHLEQKGIPFALASNLKVFSMHFDPMHAGNHNVLTYAASSFGLSTM